MDERFTSLDLVRDGAVAELVLKGPGKGNALGPDFWAEMPRAIAALDADQGVRCILLRGAGDHFTYGRELAYLAHDIDSRRALAMQLINEVFASPAELLEQARARAQAIAANPPLVVQGCKQVLEFCADKSIADGLRYGAVWNSAFLQSH